MQSLGKTLMSHAEMRWAILECGRFVPILLMISPCTSSQRSGSSPVPSSFRQSSRVHMTALRARSVAGASIVAGMSLVWHYRSRSCRRQFFLAFLIARRAARTGGGTRQPPAAARAAPHHALVDDDQPKVSAMLTGQFRGYSVERLMRLLVALGQDVEIVVKPAKRGAAELRVA